VISAVNNIPTLDNFWSNCICVRAYLRMYRPLHSQISLCYELLICVHDLMCSQYLQVSDGIGLFPDSVTVYFCKIIVSPSFVFIVVSQPMSPIAWGKYVELNAFVVYRSIAITHHCLSMAFLHTKACATSGVA